MLLSLRLTSLWFARSAPPPCFLCFNPSFDSNERQTGIFDYSATLLWRGVMRHNIVTSPPPVCSAESVAQRVQRCDAPMCGKLLIYSCTVMKYWHCTCTLCYFIPLVQHISEPNITLTQSTTLINQTITLNIKLWFKVCSHTRSHRYSTYSQRLSPLLDSLEIWNTKTQLMWDNIKCWRTSCWYHPTWYMICG